MRVFHEPITDLSIKKNEMIYIFVRYILIFHKIIALHLELCWIKDSIQY